MKMKVLAAALLLGSSSLAYAADAVVEDVVVEIPTSFNWTGGYVGGQIGYAWGDSDYVPGPGNVVDPYSYDPDGVFGGIYAGYNYQFTNNIVLGIDADINISGIDAGLAVEPPDHFANSEVKYTAAVRARLGYAVDRWLPYIAGGLSTAKYEFDLDHDGNGDWDFQDKKTLTGWNIGAGVEYAATDNIIVRAEYRFSDFGDWKYDNDWNDDNSVDLSTHDIRLGVAYKF